MSCGKPRKYPSRGVSGYIVSEYVEVFFNVAHALSARPVRWVHNIYLYVDFGSILFKL
ncbi:MAG: hypothetical protein QXY75_03985 [Candidatus Bathyarchaeia archaeon]